MYIISSAIISLLIFLNLNALLGDEFFPKVSIFFLSIVYANFEIVIKNKIIKLFFYFILISISFFNQAYYNVFITVLFSCIYKNGCDFEAKHLKLKNPEKILILGMVFLALFKNFDYGYTVGLSMICISLLSFYLAFYSSNYRKSINQVYETIDQNEVLKIKMKNEIRQLNLEKEIIIQNEILSERNKIARQIHDNVGHRISSAIFKVGAILAVNEDSETTKMIENIEIDLNNAMNDIKRSVYSIYDEVGDLKSYLEKIIKDFDFCKVNFNMNFNYLKEKSLKFMIVSIIKEALSNVIRHSNADLVNINITLKSDSLKILIVDNGTEYVEINNRKIRFREKGLGLTGMEENVKKLGGRFNCGFNKGFRIYITFPIK